MESECSDEEIRTKVVTGAQAVYRLTDLAAFDGALKFELRRRAAEILTGVTSAMLGAGGETARGLLAGTIAGMGELLRFASGMGLVTAENAERVLQCYEDIRAWVLRLPKGAASPHVRIENITFNGESLNERQRRIVEYLANNAQAPVQITEFSRLFGEECSEKTLRRDLSQLVSFGLIRKQGDNRWTTYVPLGHEMSERVILSSNY